MAFGAISFDATQSFARLPQEDKQYRGGSYRLSYSKRFEELDSRSRSPDTVSPSATL